jgi:hypothetical protein
MRPLVFVACLLAGGCLDDALYLPEALSDLAGRDLAGRDLAVRDGGLDLALPRFDFGVLDFQKGCVQLTGFSGGPVETRGSPTESPFDYVTWGRSIDGQARELSVEVWHGNALGTPPFSMTLPHNTNYLLCEVCVLLDLNYDAQKGYGAPAYLALGGTVTVTRADRTPSGGRLEVTAQDLELVEWDFVGDRPAAGDACYRIDSISLSGSYTGDAGDPPRWKGGP